MRIHFCATLLLIAGALISNAQPARLSSTNLDAFHYESKKSLSFRQCAVACAHPLAAKIGAEILKAGGNAVDAAIAVQLALAVVYPAAGNIGGGGFMVLHLKDGRNITLDFRETAPAAAFADMYVDSNGKANTDLSQNRRLAVGVPGTVAGLFAAMKYARLPFKKLIAPAIELANHGFCITAREATALNETREDFLKNNTVPPTFCKRPDWKAGDTLIQKDLAATLRRIRDDGAKGFYEGETARFIVAEMKRGKGIITLNDLKAYKAKERAPLEFDYRGYHIITMPSPSSGGVLLAQMLGMIEPYQLQSYKDDGAKSTQLMIEAERRAYADRAEYLGDPDFIKVPVKTLISKAYLQRRMTDYDSLKATPSKGITAGAIHESEETTHISITDSAGNCVSVTTTLNDSYGSKTVVSGAGFILNNEMDDFSIQPGVPNMYGAIGGKANAIAPRKRMLSSMTPSIVLKDGKPFMVVGTPGGTTIPTSVFQMIVDVIDYHLQPVEALQRPRFHHQWLPDAVQVEPGFPAPLRALLERAGYTIKDRAPIGRVELILFNDGHPEAAADERGDDSVEGW